MNQRYEAEELGQQFSSAAARKRFDSYIEAAAKNLLAGNRWDAKG